MLVSHIERLVGAASVDEARDAYFDALRGHGYSHASYRAAFHSALPAAVFQETPELMSNFPEAFVAEMEHVIAAGNCGWADWAIFHPGAITLRHLTAQQGNDPRIINSCKIAERHGLAAIRLISLKGQVARAAGIAVICPAVRARPEEEAALWRKNEREVLGLTSVMHMRIATLVRKAKNPTLTPRQREVLEWTSAGKTVMEVATILGLTAATVEKHLRLARDSLNAGSTAQAILKAHITGQIFTSAPAKQARSSEIQTPKPRTYRV